MPSTFSPNLRFELIAAGEQVGTWGDTTNRNLGTLIEQAIAGIAPISLPDTDYTLTAAQGVSDQARCAILAFTGALTAARNVIAPSVSKTYVVRNNTLGGQNVILKTAAGTGIAIPPGQSTLVFCDGTNFFGGLTYIAGPLVADSLTLNTPLPVVSGGTGGNTPAAARTGLGLGTAATQAATPTNTPNSVVQRDAAGNFSAGTITATLNGTASTSNNALNFNGQPASFYAKADTNFDWVTVFSGSTNSLSLNASYGPGVYWVVRNYSGNNFIYGVQVYGPGPGTISFDPLDLASVNNNQMYTANTVVASLGTFTTAAKLRKL